MVTLHLKYDGTVLPSLSLLLAFFEQLVCGGDEGVVSTGQPPFAATVFAQLLPVLLLLTLDD